MVGKRLCSAATQTCGHSSRESSFPGFGQVSECEDAPEVFVAAFDAASANETAYRLFTDSGMMEQVGERHSFRPGDGDAERCVDGLKLCE
jgi:hypothetical protein